MGLGKLGAVCFQLLNAHRFDEVEQIIGKRQMTIPFVQYLRPDGRRQKVSIDRSPEIEAIAQEIRAKGYTFECEKLMTGDVSLTVASPHEDEGDIEIEIVRRDIAENVKGAIGEAVDRLVRRTIKKVS